MMPTHTAFPPRLRWRSAYMPRRETRMRLSLGWITTTTVLAAISLSLSARAGAPEQNPRLPDPGTPYAQAKELLLSQGLKVAPDQAKRPDRRYPELDCSGTAGSACRALFISTTHDGWGQYIVVLVNGSDAKVVSADFARPVDGLLSIPPAEPPDVPEIAGPYLQARHTLRHLGYKPLKMGGDPARVCADRVCRTFLILPEAQCAMDVPICITFWEARNGKVLKVMTIGEIRAGRVYYADWSTRAEWRESSRQ